MAISIAWGTRVIYVPKADTQLVQSLPTEVRQLNLNDFRLDLKALEGGIEGMPEPDTHVHIAPITFGGVTLARVVEIINGYTVTFEDGIYAVNLVGANSNVADVTNVNQVSIRSSNSAGLTFSEAINQQSFTDNSVHISTTEGLPGTRFPRGTPRDPVSNLTDAEFIISEQKLKKITIWDYVVAEPARDLSGLTVIGDNPSVSWINLISGVPTTGTTFHNISLFGDATGTSTVTQSVILDGGLTGFSGGFSGCLFLGDVELDPTDLIPFTASNCASIGSYRPTFDFSNSVHPGHFANWSGNLKLTNVTSGNVITIDMMSGSTEVDATCTGGTILVRGVGQIIDNSGAGCTVDTTYLLQNDSGESAAANYTYFTAGNRADAFKADITTLEATATSIKNITDQMRFTKPNEIDANAVSGGGGGSPEEIASAVWDAKAALHNLGGSFGKFIRQMKEGLINTEASVDDANPTADSFQSTLDSSVDEYYDDSVLVFIQGSLVGQARIITTYDGATKTVTFDEPLTSPPGDGDEFIILSGHSHSKTQLENLVWDADENDHKTPGTTGRALFDASQGGGGGGGTACDPDVDRIFVNQDYGGKNNLTYVLGTIPVGQATIELFLYDDYMSGNRDAAYRIGNSRQTDDGSWAVPFYLDPNTYILQFYRPQIAGPDAYRLVVSANPAEIVFEQVDIPGTGLSGPLSPPVQTTTVIETVVETTVTGLEDFAGVGTIYVDENYGGAGALTYVKGGVPVNGADILIYAAADYNAGNRSNEYIVAASRQLSDGRWQQAVRLDAGPYKLQFFKQGVAGPDTFDLLVE